MPLPLRAVWAHSDNMLLGASDAMKLPAYIPAAMWSQALGSPVCRVYPA